MLSREYYLAPNNCVYDQNYEQIVCGLKDFQVDKNQKIVGIHDGVSDLPQDNENDPFRQIDGSKGNTWYYKAFKDA